MKCEPIFCSGNELKGVLDGIESRKGVVTDLHAGVGGNAGYMVNFFERGECEKGLIVTGRTSSPAAEKPIPIKIVSSAPTALNPLPHCTTCSSQITQGMPCPICAGIERIRDGARRLRNRFRPSNREARLPHAD